MLNWHFLKFAQVLILRLRRIGKRQVIPISACPVIIRVALPFRQRSQRTFRHLSRLLFWTNFLQFRIILLLDWMLLLEHVHQSIHIKMLLHTFSNLNNNNNIYTSRGFIHYCLYYIMDVMFSGSGSKMESIFLIHYSKLSYGLFEWIVSGLFSEWRSSLGSSGELYDSMEADTRSSTSPSC